MRLSITRQAHDAIVNAARQGHHDKLELGGSILVSRGEEDMLAAFALPPGPHSERSPAHVITDAPFQNAAIARARRRFPQLTYGGDWHVHPMGFEDLSRTDERTAFGILDDLGSDTEELLILLGVPRQWSAPMVRAFRVVSNADEHFVHSWPYDMVDDDGPAVLHHLGQPLVSMDDLLDDSDRAASPVTLDRIARDVTALREAGATVCIKTADELLGAMVRYRGQGFMVLFPPEYPLGAPHVAWLPHENATPVPIALPYGWSSHHRVLDVLDSAVLGPTVSATPPHRTRFARRLTGRLQAWTLFGRRRQRGGRHG